MDQCRHATQCHMSARAHYVDTCHMCANLQEVCCSMMMATTSWFTGLAHAVQEGSHTAGQQGHVLASAGHGCPVCAGQQACVCNSLLSLCPSVAAEFDVAKNGFPPSQITAYSGQEVWWRNANCGSWRQAVHERNDRRSQLFTQQVSLSRTPHCSN